VDSVIDRGGDLQGIVAAEEDEEESAAGKHRFLWRDGGVSMTIRSIRV
jgi:hypothetical protein